MKLRRLGATVGLAAALTTLTMPAQATVITFSGGPGDITSSTSSQVEGAFVYSAYSGTLFRSGDRGHPAPDLEGRWDVGGGTAIFARTDGGLFTFDGVDVGQFGLGIARYVVFQGFMDGALLKSDSLESSSTSNSFVSRVSVNLASVLLDELRVQLEGDGTSGADQYWEMIDNLVLTESNVPEPATLALFGLGLAGLGAMRRKKLAG